MKRNHRDKFIGLIEQLFVTPPTPAGSLGLGFPNTEIQCKVFLCGEISFGRNLFYPFAWIIYIIMRKMPNIFFTIADTFKNFLE